MTESAFTEGIADPVKPPWCNTGPVGPLSGTNKDVTGARLVPDCCGRLSRPVLWMSPFLSLTEGTALLSVSFWKV